jgi:hypothetical protein
MCSRVHQSADTFVVRNLIEKPDALPSQELLVFLYSRSNIEIFLSRGGLRRTNGGVVGLQFEPYRYPRSDHQLGAALDGIANCSFDVQAIKRMYTH